ncbi:unnamed protein product, partial [Larinioides sclopetarius]
SLPSLPLSPPKPSPNSGAKFSYSIASKKHPVQAIALRLLPSQCQHIQDSEFS